MSDTDLKSLRSIRLELARDPSYPEGSQGRGYVFVAPLTSDGHIDSKLWSSVKKHCEVRRFWVGEGEQTGLLVKNRKGWLFHYDDEDPEDDEPGFRFDTHVFKPGEYVSIREQDETLRTFRVVSVDHYRHPV